MSIRSGDGPAFWLRAFWSPAVVRSPIEIDTTENRTQDRWGRERNLLVLVRTVPTRPLISGGLAMYTARVALQDKHLQQVRDGALQNDAWQWIVLR